MSAVNRHHPHPDQLVDWAFGAADPADAAAIEQHLGGCEACRQLVADLGDLDRLEASSGWSDDDLREALGQLRQRVLVEEALAGKAIEAGFGGAGNDPFDRPGPAAETEQDTPILDEAFESVFTPPALPAIRLYPPPWVLVGVALILLIGFGLAFQRQREVNRLTLQVAELDRKAEEWRRKAVQPLANLAVVVARPFDDPSRGRPESPGQGVLVVIQSREEALPDGAWRARLEDAAGRVVLEVPNLVTQAGELRFYLPPGALPAGQYRLTIFNGETPWHQAFRLDLGDG